MNRTRKTVAELLALKGKKQFSIEHPVGIDDQEFKNFVKALGKK
jgi:hypothetical protein